MCRTLCTLLLLCWFAPVAAWQLQVDRIRTEVATLSGLQLRLQPEGGTALRLLVQIDAAQVPALAWSPRKLSIDCVVSRIDSHWVCTGAAAMSGLAADPPVSIQLRMDRSTFELDLGRAATRASVNLATGRPLRLSLKNLPLAWFNDALAAQWPASTSLTGSVDADATLTRTDVQTRLQARYSLRDAGVDTRDGAIAGAGLQAQGTASIALGARAVTVQHDGALSGGEILFGDFYAQLPKNAIAVEVHAQRANSGRWTIGRLRLNDPDVLNIDAAASLDPSLKRTLQSLDLRALDLQFPGAYTRYAKAWLAPHALGGLTIAGAMHASLQVDSQGLSELALKTDGLDIDDAQGRAAVHGLRSSIHWQRDGATEPSMLAWQSAQVYRLPIDATKWTMVGNDGELALQGGLSLPMLGGAIDFSRLSVRPAAERGERFAASLATHGVDLSRLSVAFGWPAFGGTLGGAVPDLRYRDQRLELNGGLMLNVFDGTVNVTGMSVDRPFGVAPTLTAEVDFSNLDLQLLTGTFDFGEISGRLSGAIHKLRLLNWSPAEFEADLHALDGGKISQRAVNNLSSVGGGIGAGLQASVLRIFDNFRYARIGLRCKMANNVCQMGGLDSAGQGYTIVEGRGLPRITVVGHQSKVDWPILLERLKAATTGTAPIIK